MAILDILKLPDPALKRVSEPVTQFDDALRAFIDDLEETRQHGPAAVGIAAPQVGYAKRIVIIDCSTTRKPVPNHGRLVLINPEIIEKDGVTVTEEGCLSVPGYYEEVERAEHIRVRFLNRDGEHVEMEAEDLLAICIQHEMDHLDGKLFVDYLSPLKRQMVRKRLEKARRQAKQDARASAVPG